MHWWLRMEVTGMITIRFAVVHELTLRLLGFCSISDHVAHDRILHKTNLPYRQIVLSLILFITSFRSAGNQRKLPRFGLYVRPNDKNTSPDIVRLNYKLSEYKWFTRSENNKMADNLLRLAVLKAVLLGKTREFINVLKYYCIKNERPPQMNKGNWICFI